MKNSSVNEVVVSRQMRAARFLLLLGFSVLGLASTSVACGKERWAQKTLADAESAKIDFASVRPATIEQLIAYKAPAGLHSNPTRRPEEYVVLRVTAVLVAYKLESDGDYHVVLGSLTNPSKTMIVEMPDPACMTQAYRPAAYNVRVFIDTIKKPSAAGRLYPGHGVVVTVTGVCFFDFKHGQTGVAPNAIELHPVLTISASSAPRGGSTESGSNAVGSN